MGFLSPFPFASPHPPSSSVNGREIQGSCCAAEVSAIGSEVTKFKVGDRVAPTVNLNFLLGDERDADVRALGGEYRRRTTRVGGIRRTASGEATSACVV